MFTSSQFKANTMKYYTCFPCSDVNFNLRFVRTRSKVCRVKERINITDFRCSDAQQNISIDEKRSNKRLRIMAWSSVS